jgi:signal transduction histidine kinase
VLFLVVEVVDQTDEGVRQLWQVPGALVVCALAVLAPRRPFDAALATAVALIAGSMLLRIVGVPPSPPLLSGILISEGAAIMALIAILVRQSPPLQVVVGVVLLVGVVAASQSMRPDYWDRFYSEYSYSGPNVWQNLIAGGVLLILSVGTGLYFRSRDRERASSVEAEVLAAQHAERMALARELHDVVAHYVTGIVVHAQAAQAVVAMNPDAAREVLPIIANSGAEALTAMRRLVGTLRGSELAPSGSAMTTSDIAADVREVAEQSGQPVHLEFDLPDQVPPELGRSVLRLVQESLTNARKHAEQLTRVDVSVSTRDGVVHVLVVDDGRGGRQVPVGGSGGFGLVGMRERVELLGGTFGAGRRPDGGWEVRAELPIAR